MHEPTIRKFRKVLRRFEWGLNTQTTSCGCCGVTLPQCHALMALEEEEGVSLNELAGKLRLDTSTTSRIINGLVKQQLVERIIPPENRRAVSLTMTEQGRQVSKNIHQTNDSYFGEVLGELTEKELDEFMITFEKVAKGMEKVNELDRNEKRIIF